MKVWLIEYPLGVKIVSSEFDSKEVWTHLMKMAKNHGGHVTDSTRKLEEIWVRTSSGLFKATLHEVLTKGDYRGA